MWAEWGSWSLCPVTCDRGAQFRSRECISSHKRQLCIGNPVDANSCNIIPCHGTYLFMCLYNFLYVIDQSYIYLFETVLSTAIADLHEGVVISCFILH